MDQNTAQTTPVVASDTSTVLPPAPVEPEEELATVEPTPVMSDQSSPEPVATQPEQVVTDTATTAPVPMPQSDTTVSDQIPPETNPDAVTSEEREKLYKELAEKMLQGLETGEIEVEASEDSSEYILEHLDKVQTKAELMAFLEEVGNRWPVYKTMTTKEVTEQKDQDKITDIQDQLHQFIKE